MFCPTFLHHFWGTYIDKLPVVFFKYRHSNENACGFNNRLYIVTSGTAIDRVSRSCFKRFMWSNEWKGLLIKRLQKKMGTFCGKNQALLMNDLPTYYLVLNLQTYLVCDNPNIFLHILPLLVLPLIALCTCLDPTWSYLALHLSYSSKFCLTKGEA